VQHKGLVRGKGDTDMFPEKLFLGLVFLRSAHQVQATLTHDWELLKIFLYNSPVDIVNL
jgi:hypothetical protein